MHTTRIVLSPAEVPTLEERLAELAAELGRPLNFSLLLPVGKPPALVGFFKTREDSLRQLRLLGLEARARHGFLRDRDWQDSVKRHFKPFAYRNVAWMPSWEKKLPRSLKAKTVIKLEIGMAFGTGNHPTTKLCLRRLVDALARLRFRKSKSKLANSKLRRGDIQNRGISVLDIGCGSGILAITAERLGARASGFDLDAHSIVVARKNARMNRSAAKFSVRDLYRTRLAPADIVLANLLGNLITDNARKLWSAVRPGGTLILSGLLKTELAAIAALFPAPARATRLGQWGVLVLQKPLPQKE